MRRRSLERELDALGEGRLGPEARERLERLLASQSEEGRQLRRTRALGALVREAWSEGPPSPEADRLLAVLRPALRRVDAELERPAVPVLWLRRLLAAPRLVPAGTLAVAVGALLVGLPMIRPDDAQVPPSAAVAVPRPGAGAPAAGPAAPSVERAAETTLYDLDAAGPVMVIESDDATVLWIEEPDSDGISRAPRVTGGWI